MTCILKGIGDAAGRHTLTETFRDTPMKLSNIGVFFYLLHDKSYKPRLGLYKLKLDLYKPKLSL